MNELLKKLWGDAENMTLAELQDKVEKSGVKLADLSTGDYVSKAKADSEIAKAKQEAEAGVKTVLEKQIAEKDNALKERDEKLKAFEGIDPAKVKEFPSQIENVKKSYEVKMALTAAGAKDIVSVLPHIDMDKVKFNDKGEIEGLSEQVETLKKEKDFLFEGDKKTVFKLGGGHKPADDKDDAFLTGLRSGAKKYKPVVGVKK